MKNTTIRELAVDFTIEVTKVCDEIKGRDVYVNQLLRSASSIGANSYEANYAQSKADFISKLKIALKECYETEYWLIILNKIGNISEEQFIDLNRKCGNLRHKLISAITKTDLK